ncbi:group 1 glycosyl transferase [Calothrix sp. NIES-4101]|nr:group 1 glycosyl transferase [Calothrix sp. NIES-4101]
MKLLIQHRHDHNEISGVLTYINYLIPEFQNQGIDVQQVSTKQNSILTWVKLIFWADIVHMNSNNLLFALICKLLGKKIIIKYHYSFYQSAHVRYESMSFLKRLKIEVKSSLPKPNYPWKWKLYTAVKWVRLATRLSTAFLANQHIACSDFLGKACNFSWKVNTLYNPIKVQSQYPIKKLVDISKPYTFVFMGRLAHDKGVDILLKAAKILHEQEKKFQLLIIGNGAQAQDLKQLAEKLDILSVVTFLGQLSHQEGLLKVKDALALIAPSRWQDPAPYVVLEASSVQTCSIVSQMGGLPEVAGHHSLFFENENAVELANCMSYCLENPQEIITRGWQSSQYVMEKFSPASAANEFLSICSQCS